MTGNATSIDAARVELLLTELRLPGVKTIWPKIAAQSDKEGWPAARFLAALAEFEPADRARRRIERHMAEARLPAGKTLAAFDFESVPMVSSGRRSPPSPTRRAGRRLDSSRPSPSSSPRPRRRIERHMARGRPAGRQDPRRFRLRKRADGVEGAGEGPRLGRSLA
jgi:hypothetical protein